MIILLGGSGYVGTSFRLAMQRRGIPFLSVARAQCDYYRPGRLMGLVEKTAPEFLINAAGYTGRPNVDACESEKGACIVGNVTLPAIIREVCGRHGLPWGHVSSGCIYSGTREDGLAFTEADAPNFTFRHKAHSFYSGCKALAEELLQDAERCYIWRLRIPFDHRDSDRNYLSKLMRYECLLNVRNSFTHLGEFVDACLDCWEQRLDFGTYNLTNTAAMSTREVVDMIRHSGVCDKSFEFFESEEHFMRLAARTPRSSCELDNTKATRAGLRLSSLTDCLRASLTNWVWGHGRAQSTADISNWQKPEP